MTQLTPSDIRRKLLSERGLTVTKPHPRRHRQLRPTTKLITGGPTKTPLMKYLEQKYGRSIEELLLSGSLNVVAKLLDNEVDRTTLSRWIKRFKLRYTKDNLPDCEGCPHHGPACESGVCYVLIEQGLYELVEVKKKELMEG